MEYAYGHFDRARAVEAMRWRGGPAPGERLPEFDLVTTTGGRVRRRDLAGAPVLLVCGSLT